MGKGFGAGAIAGLVVGAALASSACTVHQTEIPALAGPSDFALSMNVTATPDSLALDGGSQSAVVVETRDAAGAPRPGVPIRLDIMVGSTIQDCGQLSARNVVTGSDGRATAVFTAPSMPLPFPNCLNFSPGSAITIAATPGGSNFQTFNVRTATIRLVPTGVIVPPADTPAPSFTVSPATPAANAPASFNASASCGGTLSGGVCPSSSPRITAYSWSFGDGFSASGVTVSHGFALAGTYNVTLTATNDRGVSASTTQAVTVGTGVLPTAAFSFSPTTPVVGQQVVFNGSASVAGAGHTITQYTWVFGDGASKNGMIVEHDFNATGTYNVSLTVTDESGQKSTLVSAVPIGATTAVPKASFTYTPGSPVSSGTTVSFDASASTASNGARIVSYTWDFGDGATFVVTGPTTNHTYNNTTSSPVTRTITLTITDSLGSTNTTSRTITVTP